MFTSKTSHYICIVLAFSTRKVLLVSTYIVMIGLVMQPCLKYMEKKNDRSCSPSVLTSHIFQEFLCHNDQQIIAINSKLLQQTIVATKFVIVINSKLLQQTPLTMNISVAHYCNKVCGNRLLQPKKKKPFVLSFQQIVVVENFLYCFGIILEFETFVCLQVKHPTTYALCQLFLHAR